MRYLIVANQTLAEAQLADTIRQRLEAGPSSVHILVPDTSARDLAGRMASRVPLSPVTGDPTTDAEATTHAQHRLGQLVRDLGELGAEVDGAQLGVGTPSPPPASVRLGTMSRSDVRAEIRQFLTTLTRFIFLDPKFDGVPW